MKINIIFRNNILLLSLFIFLILQVSLLAEQKPKVIILGFDGADYRLASQYLEEGKLPNLDRLRKNGVFTNLIPTNPPQTPVSWASFMTGLDPGGTGICDFLKRVPGTYLPDYVVMSEGTKKILFGKKNPIFIPLLSFIFFFIFILIVLKIFKAKTSYSLILSLIFSIAISSSFLYFSLNFLPEKQPYPINNMKGTPFFKQLVSNGIRVKVFHIPDTFPPPELGGAGKLLAGLGIPDMRGTIGYPALYTTNSKLFSASNEFSVRIVYLDKNKTSWDSDILGPRNKLFYDPSNPAKMREKGIKRDITVPLRVELIPSTKRLRLIVQDRIQEIGIGEWSDWFELEFPFNRFIKVKGIGKFYLESIEPEIMLHLTPINIHPRVPIFPISFPPKFSGQIADLIGLYKTIGWRTDTWSISSFLGTEEYFISDMFSTAEMEEEMMIKMLEEKDWDVFIFVYMFTDRAQHVMWRLIDPKNPIYDKTLAEKWGDTILKAYQKMDSIVGRVMEIMDKDTILMVISDHGFAPFRRGINLNVWLRDNGFLVEKVSGKDKLRNLEDLWGAEGRSIFPHVDWSRTKAFSLGLGGIYINLKGREPEGSVEPEEYEKVKEEIVKKMEAFVDPVTGERPVFRVYKREEIYRDFDAEIVPDLRAATNYGYRVSWQSTLGGMNEDVVQDNDKNWSADHCTMEPSQINGIFFSNRRINKQSVNILDFYRSICKLYNLNPPKEIQGENFF
ncbi:MAG: alkaline phosphatase family protein [Candidatus Aminicenantia bacterium]